MFELVHLCIYWAGCKTPFIDVTFPQTVDATLTDVVEGELKRKRHNYRIVYNVPGLEDRSVH